MYADDIMLLASSVSALQQLLYVCETQLQWLDMSINKSACINKLVIIWLRSTDDRFDEQTLLDILVYIWCQPQCLGLDVQLTTPRNRFSLPIVQLYVLLTSVVRLLNTLRSGAQMSTSNLLWPGSFLCTQTKAQITSLDYAVSFCYGFSTVCDALYL